ncbi:M48 family metalloprotease [Pedosphaera parvula]|nr:M48 family metalloprotease [Pedosphaera parvula]
MAMENPGQNLKPLPYHVELRDYLKSQERDLWNWFASAQAKADYTEHLLLELLKATYRLDPANHADLYAAAEEAKQRLQLNIPITIYQAQNSNQLNATLYYIPGEGHLVFSGPVFSLLSPDELRSVLGHELAHYHLWQCDEGEFLIADRMLQAIANDPRAAGSHVQSARWFQLYTEIFCDRGSFCVTGKLDEVVSGLVKIQTGLQHVSATSYLKQAEEVFEKTRAKTAEMSHPETFIRARALALWAEQHPESTGPISAMIEGAAELDELDLVGQKRWTILTRRLLAIFLRPKWFQTQAVLGHAKLFFEDFQPAQADDAEVMAELKSSDAKLREYLCYLLLDFVVADPELEEMPLAAALEMAKLLSLESLFEKSVAKELKIKARDLKRLKEKAPEMLAKAEVQP